MACSHANFKSSPLHGNLEVRMELKNITDDMSFEIVTERVNFICEESAFVRAQDTSDGDYMYDVTE